MPRGLLGTTFDRSTDILLSDPRFGGAMKGLVIIAVVLGVFVYPSGAWAQASEEPSEGDFLFGGVSFPSEVERFRAMRSTRWDDPDLGVGVTYFAQGVPAEFSIYIYPSRKGLDAEFQEAMDAISTFAERGRGGQSVEVQSTDSVVVAGVDGRLGVTRMGDVRSLLYVFEKDGSFLKYRLSHEPALRVALEEEIALFIETTLEGITVHPN
jgi:hypothetical protein